MGTPLMKMGEFYPIYVRSFDLVVFILGMQNTNHSHIIPQLRRSQGNQGTKYKLNPSFQNQQYKVPISLQHNH